MSKPVEQNRLINLRQILATRFDDGELRTLCFDLKIDYESLPGAGKADKARELIAYCERHDCIASLIETTLRQRPNVSEDGLKDWYKEDDGIHFARIEMATKDCLWSPIEYHVGSLYPLWAHQLAVFMWSETEIESDQRVTDPVFDVTLINVTEKPALLIGVGFKAIDRWSITKGLPVAGKVRVVDAYELHVIDFIPGKTTMLKLDDPVYMAPQAPYRYKLRLSDYRKAIRVNESAINLVVEADNHVFLSDQIHLGMY